MRESTVLKEAFFEKEGVREQVTLPHTWNAFDGQDGGNDYYRGTCTYQIALPDPTEGKRQFIQFEGVNHIAVVSCNGQLIGEHRGGFSTFRYELTSYMNPAGNMLEVKVDNEAPDVYPQKADFTFFGGIYRNVTFLETEREHIDLMKDGTDGVFVTPQADGTTRVDVFVTDAKDCEAVLTLKNHQTGEIKTWSRKQIVTDGNVQLTFEEKVENPKFWDGTKNPVLYEAVVQLTKQGEVSDEVQALYGYRSFKVDADTGFYLNGTSYPLHGVSRHQDRQDKGWAISEEDHAEDLAIIREMGANAIRLAHYQHSQTFYDLCDESGMVLWAEIPFISTFIPTAEARENTLSQMRELIAQNYNHPSICFWGISNEITISGEPEGLVENLEELNALAKQMDPSRLTTMAHISTVKPGTKQCGMTDIMGYNIYCGWYIGEVEQNGEMLDTLHEGLSGRPFALSEYGADALTTWHSAKPKNHDYTEEYQAFYHEKMLETFATRPYLWATYVWNMFDFAADARDEGGCKGKNNKGLVTYDRKIRKDAYYIYQAYWSNGEMVHICGSRFVNRAPGERSVKIYTNSSEVTLYLDNVEVETKQAKDHICVFELEDMQPGEHEIKARTENGMEDCMTLNAVLEPDKSYRMPEDEMIAGNWFDEETGETMAFEYPEGYFNIKDTMGDILRNPAAAAIIMSVKEQSAKSGQTGGSSLAGDTTQGGGRDNTEMMKSLGAIPLIQLMKLGSMKVETKDLLKLNRALNQIKKEE